MNFFVFSWIIKIKILIFYSRQATEAGFRSVHGAYARFRHIFFTQTCPDDPRPLRGNSRSRLRRGQRRDACHAQDDRPAIRRRKQQPEDRASCSTPPLPGQGWTTPECGVPPMASRGWAMWRWFRSPMGNRSPTFRPAISRMRGPAWCGASATHSGPSRSIGAGRSYGCGSLLFAAVERSRPAPGVSEQRTG